MDDELRYEPLFEQGGLTVSRSPWGDDDEIGRLNWMTPASQQAVLARVDGERVYDLAVEYFVGMPSWVEAHDPKYDIWMTHTPQGTVVDDLNRAGADANRAYSYAGTAFTMYSHTGTHVCSLAHIGHHGTFWNGWRPESHLGSRAWRVGGRYPPIVARGVLLDVAREQGVECLDDSYGITPDDLAATAASAGVALRRGDVVLVRTGRMTLWPDADRFLASPPGLDLSAAAWLCEEAGAMCVGVDAGGEVLPPERPNTFLPVHAYLSAVAGAPVFENVWLEELAADRVTEFAFLAFPLKLRGSTGMPVRPVAFPLTP
jgi:kynurenine formamidase